LNAKDADTAASTAKALTAKTTTSKTNKKVIAPKKVSNPSSNPNPTPKDAAKGKLTTLQSKMSDKLKGSQFRWINEQLYTTHSSTALSLFKKQPELFQLYHDGFSTQVKDWPVNPNDIFISQLSQLKDVVVADMVSLTDSGMWRSTNCPETTFTA
jgi:ribosomal RNA-processing protein 8